GPCGRIGPRGGGGPCLWWEIEPEGELGRAPCAPPDALIGAEGEAGSVLGGIDRPGSGAGGAGFAASTWVRTGGRSGVGRFGPDVGSEGGGAIGGPTLRGGIVAAASRGAGAGASLTTGA